MSPRALVVAKAPVPGRVKTRLAATVGDEAAARLAAAALADTLLACRAAFEECHLALDGDLADGVDARVLLDLVRGWHVAPQGDGDLGDRLAEAHERLADLGGGPVVQVGMDTPHLSPADLVVVGERCRPGAAVLGAADDGGWWVLALDAGRGASRLRGVPTSTPTTGADTRRALGDAGLDVLAAPVLRDVDTAADARVVAALAPSTRFARTWARLDRQEGAA